jgi:hypothetical protein
MSWANVRAGLVATISALVPTTGAQGRRRYMRLDRESPEESAVDRAFVVRMAAQERVGTISNGEDEYLTEAELVVRYLRSNDTGSDEDRIAQDAAQLQAALKDPGVLHTDAIGIIGDPQFAVSLRDDGNGYTLGVAFTVRHA